VTNTRGRFDWAAGTLHFIEQSFAYWDDGPRKTAVGAAAARTGLTYPSAGLPVGNPAADVTGHLDRTSLSANITGRDERYICEAEPEIRAAAAQLGEFLLIVTHAADPYQLTADTLMGTLASPVTLAGWARL
jgi:hypothetical protein